MEEFVLSSNATIHPGIAEAEGTEREFRSLTSRAGEPVIDRCELLRESRTSRSGHTLIRFVHLTDVQLADVKSPSRFEYVNRFWDDPMMEGLVPGQRAQEFLVAHTLAEYVRTINELARSNEGGSGVHLVVTTGDAIDNAQHNEFEWFTALLSGGSISLESGSQEQEMVQAKGFGDAYYWHPDGGEDIYKSRFGYPTVPGLLADAMVPIESEGLSVPWIACNGNHELLVQGVGRVNDEVDEVTRGVWKSILPPPSREEPFLGAFIHSPDRFFADAQSVRVYPEPARALGDRRMVVGAYLSAPGEPRGHGFTPSNLEEGTAYYSWDYSEDVRFIALDTAHADGAAGGALDWVQARWLEDRLSEASDRIYRDGRWRTVEGGEPRWVIVISHHPLQAIDNPLVRDDSNYISSTELEGILHRHGNVVLLLNGHTHQNAVVAYPSPFPGGPGIWQVTSSSIMDWPAQCRMIEIVEHDEGLEIRCEMINLSVPLDPNSVSGSSRLAAWHRLIASNAPFDSQRGELTGLRQDRNVVLHIDTA